MPEPTEPREQLRAQRLANRLATERIRAARLQRAEVRESRRHLTESLSLDWVAPYADLLDRFRANGDPILSGPASFWNRRYGRNWPIFQTEQELALLRAPARLLAATNDDAIGLIHGLSAYVIGAGYTYRPAKRRKESEFPAEALQAIQRVVDEILEANEWTGGELPGIEDECFWRSVEDGEFVILSFPQSDGSTEFRILEPEQLTQPPGHSDYDWLFGVCTPPDDVQKALAYWFQFGDSPTDGEEFEPERVTHFRRNGRRGQKRGLTDLCFSTADKLNLSNSLRLNLADTAAQQAAIPYVMQHDNAAQDEVQAFRDEVADFQIVEPLTGQQRSVRKSRRGEGQDIPKGQVYVDGPGAPYSDKHLAILDACLRGVVTRWNGFEWLISANAGTNNLPADLSAESPFVRRVLKEQGRYTSAFAKPVWRAVEHFVRTRGLSVGGRSYSWEEIVADVDLLVQAPSPQTRNKLEETQRAAIEIPLGVDSRQRFMQDQGRDPDQIEADNQQWQDEHGGGGGNPLPLPGEMRTESLLLESKDAEGHEHKGTGAGGGQFTSGSGGGGGGEKGAKKPQPSPEEKKAAREAHFERLMAAKKPADAAAFRKAREDGVSIPPAWTEVVYHGANENIVAEGRDDKGHKQRAENPQYRQNISDANNARIAKDLTPRMGELRDELRAAAKAGNEEAKVLYLITLTGFRIGGKGDGKAKEQAFGASSLMGDHVRVEGNTVTFDFPGKHGVRQQHSVTDPVVAKMMQNVELGKPVFATRETKVRDAWQTKYGGEKVHDIRHAVASEIAKRELAKRIPPFPKNEKGKTAIIKDVATTVAHTLGNDPAQALGTYIDPALWKKVKVVA